MNLVYNFHANIENSMKILQSKQAKATGFPHAVPGVGTPDGEPVAFACFVSEVR